MNKKKILVVDDDPAINEAIEFILKDAGYEVITTTDSTRVVRLLFKKPDLILLDIWMPGIDGRELCKALKQNKKTNDIPIIMVSATREIKAIALEAGANDYINKPFEMNELLAKLAQHIS